MSEFLLFIEVHFWLMYVYFGLGDTLKFLICCFLLFLVIKWSIYSPAHLALCLWPPVEMLALAVSITQRHQTVFVVSNLGDAFPL